MKKWFGRGLAVALIVLNIATVINANVYDVLHGAISEIPIENLLSKSKASEFHELKRENSRLLTENKRAIEREKMLKSNYKKAQNITEKISRRTVKNVITNTSSVAVEAIPTIGIAAILAVTAVDVYDGCQTLKDTNQLLELFGEEPDDKNQEAICGIELPSLDELKQKVMGSE